MLVKGVLLPLGVAGDGKRGSGLALFGDLFVVHSGLSEPHWYTRIRNLGRWSWKAFLRW